MVLTLELLIILFGITILYVSVTSRIEAFIKILSFQGFLLFLIIAIDYKEINTIDFIIFFIETIIIKMILIPLFLMRVMHRNEIYREIEPYISNFYSLLIATLIFSFGFFVAYWSIQFSQSIKPLHFGISISTILIGLFIFMTRKKVITHVLSYVTIENGIFLLSLSIASKMPKIVELGILLDLFLVIFLLGLFINRIKTTYDEIDIDILSDLKD